MTESNSDLPVLRPISDELASQLHMELLRAIEASHGLVDTITELGKRPGYGRVRIVIEVHRRTTTEELRNAIPPALQLRDWLSENQLLTLDSDEALYGSALEQTLERIDKRVITYRGVADHVNENINRYLSSPSIKDWGYAHLWMEIYDFSKTEIDELIAEGLKNKANGLPPFEKGRPITRDRVIRVLRKWRNSPARGVYRRIHHPDAQQA